MPKTGLLNSEAGQTLKMFPGNTIVKLPDHTLGFIASQQVLLVNSALRLRKNRHSDNCTCQQMTVWARV